jgi:hypothetical protein
VASSSLPLIPSGRGDPTCQHHLLPQSFVSQTLFEDKSRHQTRFSQDFLRDLHAWRPIKPRGSPAASVSQLRATAFALAAAVWFLPILKSTIATVLAVYRLAASREPMPSSELRLRSCLRLYLFLFCSLFHTRCRRTFTGGTVHPIEPHDAAKPSSSTPSSLLSPHPSPLCSRAIFESNHGL